MLTLDRPNTAHDSPSAVPHPPMSADPLGCTTSPPPPPPASNPPPAPYAPSSSAASVPDIHALLDPLLDPDADPRDIAREHNLPLRTLLDIFDSGETQAFITRLERMQLRRAEFHLAFNKPLAARNLTLILEASLDEEMNRATRDTKEAAATRYRQRELTRKTATAVLRGWPIGTKSPARERTRRAHAQPDAAPDTAHHATRATARASSSLAAPATTPPTRALMTKPESPCHQRSSVDAHRPPITQVALTGPLAKRTTELQSREAAAFNSEGRKAWKQVTNPAREPHRGATPNPDLPPPTPHQLE